MKMRRHDRELTEREDIIDILRKSTACRLAFNDAEAGVPYILPLNFGFAEDADGTITLYFHGATEGHKYEVISRDNRASFEIDCDHEIVSDHERGYCTMRYRSVIGRGRVEMVDGYEAKREALSIMTDKYHATHFEFNPAAIGRTTVMRLVVEGLTAKQRK